MILKYDTNDLKTKTDKNKYRPFGPLEGLDQSITIPFALHPLSYATALIGAI